MSSSRTIPIAAPLRWLLLCQSVACGVTARASDDPPEDAAPAAALADDEAIADTESAAVDGAFEEDGDGGDVARPGAGDPSLAAAQAKVDAAIAAAASRGEQERLTIAQQRAELDAEVAELDGRMKAIDGLEHRIDELLGSGEVARTRRRERVEQLATLVATMSPAAAATMLAQMSDAQAQDLLMAVAQNDKRKAAKLIATMPPARAAAIGQRYLVRDPQALDAEGVPPDMPERRPSAASPTEPAVPTAPPTAPAAAPPAAAPPAATPPAASPTGDAPAAASPEEGAP